MKSKPNLTSFHRAHPVFSVSALLLLAWLLGAPSASALVKTWDGSSSGLWNVAANWAGNAIPADGDDLIFPVGALNLNNTNNIVGLDLRSITFNAPGYTLNQNAIALTTDDGINGDHAAGNCTVNLPITLATNTTFSCVNAGAFLIVGGSVNLNGHHLTNTTGNAAAEIDIGGIISGTGDLVKSGTGILLLDGQFNNTYVGTTRIFGGTLELNDIGAATAMVPGDVIISAGAILLLTEENQIADTADITVLGTSTGISTSSGILNLNGFNETIASLTLSGGDVTTGLGILTLGGNVTASATGGGLTLVNGTFITGNLSLGSVTRTFSVTGNPFASPELNINAVISGTGGLVKSGSGEMRLSGANTYSGLTTISNGQVFVNTTTPFGSSAAGTDLAGGTVLIEGMTVANEWLTNSSASSDLQAESGSTSIWSSNIVLNATLSVQVFTNGLLNLSGQVTGAGGITKSGPGTLQYSGATVNSYAGTTTVNEGLLEFNKSAADGAINAASTLVIGDGVGPANSDIVRNLAGNQLDTQMDIIVNETGLYDLDGFSETVDFITIIGGDITTGAGTLTMNDNLSATSTTIGGSAVISGNLALGASIRTFTVTNGTGVSDLVISASVSGTGGMAKDEAGRMTLTTSNSFSGAVTVNDGVLRLDDSFAAGTTAGGVTVTGDSIVELVNNAHVGAETLTLSNISAGATSALSVPVSNSNSWAGNITLSTNAEINVLNGGTLNFSGAISGPGAITLVGGGELYYSGGGANTYGGVTTVSDGTLVLAKSIGNGAMTNNLTIGDGVGGINADVVRTELTAQLPNTVAVTVNSSGLIEFNFAEDFGSLAGSGRVTLNAGISPGYNDSTTTFSGIASGTGSFNKYGTGTMTLSGANTHTGATTANAGILRINGFQPQSPVSVGAAGTLGGFGTVGNLNNGGGGVVAPGTSAGRLTCSNATFALVSSDYTVEIFGTSPGGGYDQLDARGTVNLGGSTLNVTAGGYLGFEGQNFVIVSNDAADAVVGTFNGLAEGAIITSGLFKFRLSYAGGTGNDVTLTLTNSPFGSSGALVVGGNGDVSPDPNECSLIYLVITNSSGTAISNIFTQISTTNEHVILHQAISDYAPIPANGKGTNLMAFQLSTLPGFACGSTIQLQMSMFGSSGGNGITFNLPSGHPGATLQFTNSAFLGIPDVTSVNSTNLVSGISNSIAKVTVSVYLTHPNDGDLALRLIGPDGQLVVLSDFNGSTGNDYGSDCAPGSYTVFDDAAGTGITAGSPPYVGTFRPEGSLASYIGKTGAGANGNWVLQIEDDVGGGPVGTLRCWVLAIAQTECASGSGICDTCPGYVADTLNGVALTNVNRMFRNGTPGQCGAPLLCAGSVPDFGPYRYDMHVFTNSANFSRCYRVYLDTACEDAISASAYVGSYQPTNVCQNFLAEMGSIPSKTFDSFSFIVPAATNFIVVVNEVSGGAGCDYTMVVTGDQCPRPVLNITPAAANSVKLDWTTAAAGYQLERTNNLVTGVLNWPPVTNNPVVVSGRFTVTNSTVGTTNNFYRLKLRLID